MSRSSDQGQEPKKDEEFWFDDGNIVILAGDTTFRLHKSILSSVSPVFKDMFSISQPDDAETMDGCHVVSVSDSPSDLRHFFRLLTKPAFNLLRSDFMPSFRMLAAVCRIGHKYQAAEAVEFASERIETFFNGPSSLFYHLSLARESWDTFWESYQGRLGLKVDLTDAFEAVNLVRLLGRPQVPPLALYLCCAGDPLHLRTGVTREDGTIESLSDDDYRTCTQAIPKLLAKGAQDVRLFFAYYKDGHGRANCVDGQRCQQAFRDMYAEMDSEVFSEGTA